MATHKVTGMNEKTPFDALRADPVYKGIVIGVKSGLDRDVPGTFLRGAITVARETGDKDYAIELAQTAADMASVKMYAAEQRYVGPMGLRSFAEVPDRIKSFIDPPDYEEISPGVRRYLNDGPGHRYEAAVNEYRRYLEFREFDVGNFIKAMEAAETPTAVKEAARAFEEKNLRRY